MKKCYYYYYYYYFYISILVHWCWERVHSMFLSILIVCCLQYPYVQTHALKFWMSGYATCRFILSLSHFCYHFVDFFAGKTHSKLVGIIWQQSQSHLYIDEYTRFYTHTELGSYHSFTKTSLKACLNHPLQQNCCCLKNLKHWVQIYKVQWKIQKSYH